MAPSVVLSNRTLPIWGADINHGMGIAAEVAEAHRAAGVAPRLVQDPGGQIGCAAPAAATAVRAVLFAHGMCAANTSFEGGGPRYVGQRSSPRIDFIFVPREVMEIRVER